MPLQEEYKRKIIAVLSALFPNTRIILYGSRARGSESERSDIDVALDAGKPLEQLDVSEARDMLNESNIPYTIDIVDLHTISELMQKIIIREGVIWKA